MIDTTLAEQRRAFRASMELAALTPSGRFLEGRAVPYGEWQDVGGYHEMHIMGEFEESLDRWPTPPLLLFHETRTFPIGVLDSWQEGAEGLDCIWRLDSSEEAQRGAQLAKKGMLTGLSVGFVPQRSDWTIGNSKAGELDRVLRMKSRLLEVSLVSTPAFDGARVSLVRTLQGVNRQPRKAELHSWLAGRSMR